MAALGGSTARVRKTRILSSSAQAGGAVAALYGSSLSLEGSLVHGSSAAVGAGALGMNGSRLDIRASVVSGSRTAGFATGLAVRWGSRVDVDGSHVTDDGDNPYWQLALKAPAETRAGAARQRHETLLRLCPTTMHRPKTYRAAGLLRLSHPLRSIHPVGRPFEIVVGLDDLVNLPESVMFGLPGVSVSVACLSGTSIGQQNGTAQPPPAAASDGTCGGRFEGGGATFRCFLSRSLASPPRRMAFGDVSHVYLCRHLCSLPTRRPRLPDATR